MKSSSPHLISYVHTLDIESCDTGEIHILVAQIPWSHVHMLSLRQIPVGRPGRVIDSVHLLVGILLLHDLTLESSSSLPRAALSCLKLLGYELEPSSLNRHQPSDFASPRSKIRELRLWSSPGVEELLNKLACPLDCSALRHIGLGRTKANPMLNALLRRSRATIESLHVDQNCGQGDDEALDDLNLTCLPAVHHISANLFALGSPLVRILARWPTPERITSISFITSAGSKAVPRYFKLFIKFGRLLPSFLGECMPF
ncbi:hypothetical protein B0H12DRAFT_1235686 [Mycena haematopus]|nr:hypothetical protein B0H12DRAFT_1235686 [Mycena haematopus]